MDWRLAFPFRPVVGKPRPIKVTLLQVFGLRGMNEAQRACGSLVCIQLLCRLVQEKGAACGGVQVAALAQPLPLLGCGQHFDDGCRRRTSAGGGVRRSGLFRGKSMIALHTTFQGVKNTKVRAST